MHELIAPRPVRIASNPLLPYNRRAQHIRPIKLVQPLSPPDPFTKQSIEAVEPIPEEPQTRSPPTTPRSPGPLPAETLEEFLSILRPSVMPFHSLRVYSTSPICQSLRTHTPRVSISSSISNFDSISPAGSPDVSRVENNKSTELDPVLARWRSGGILSSPVSRNHTRNPFARHPDHENLALSLSHEHPLFNNDMDNDFNPSVISNTQSEHCTPLSPSQIPLPPSTTPPPLSFMESKDALVH